jgi:hypothetical protein
VILDAGTGWHGHDADDLQHGMDPQKMERWSPEDNFFYVFCAYGINEGLVLLPCRRGLVVSSSHATDEEAGAM